MKIAAQILHSEISGFWSQTLGIEHCLRHCWDVFWNSRGESCAFAGVFLRNIWELQQKSFALHLPSLLSWRHIWETKQPTLHFFFIPIVVYFLNCFQTHSDDDFRACRLLSCQPCCRSLYVGLLLSCHYGHCCHGGETKQQGVSLCFLGRRPPMSDRIHNDQGVAVSITTHSLHKPACEQTEVKSMNIASQSLTLLCMNRCVIYSSTHSNMFKDTTASRRDQDWSVYS